MMTISEAATALRVSEDTLRSIVREGRLPRIQLSSRRFAFDPADVAAFLERSKCQSTEKAADKALKE